MEFWYAQDHAFAVSPAEPTTGRGEFVSYGANRANSPSLSAM